MALSFDVFFASQTLREKVDKHLIGRAPNNANKLSARSLPFCHLSVLFVVAVVFVVVVVVSPVSPDLRLSSP